MTWDLKLTALYIWGCDCFDEGVCEYTRRYNKNASTQVLKFTDEEAITVYLFGILQKYKEVKDIYTFAKNHLLDWFPDLPSYEKFNERLNRLNNAFAILAQIAGQRVELPTGKDSNHHASGRRA